MASMELPYEGAKEMIPVDDFFVIEKLIFGVLNRQKGVFCGIISDIWGMNWGEAYGEISV